ncbi:MAG: hypothetical protein QXU88_02630 [Candidatus Woesearchaeota archaeon]
MSLQFLKDVPQEHAFRLKDGPELKNLYELAEKLGQLSEHQFRHHVNDSKNDFKNWVQDVIKDDILATRLARAKDKRVAQLEVLNRIKELEARRDLEEAHYDFKKNFKLTINEFVLGLGTGLIAGAIIARAIAGI